MIVFSFPCFLKGNTIMPNRTIYVAGVDLPIFEKAQKLAGDNLFRRYCWRTLQKYLEVQ